jgi:hypothetical protein
VTAGPASKSSLDRAESTQTGASKGSAGIEWDWEAGFCSQRSGTRVTVKQQPSDNQCVATVKPVDKSFLFKINKLENLIKY